MTVPHISKSPSDPSSASHPQRWARDYDTLLHSQLQRAIQLVRKRTIPPDELSSHFQSFITLLNQARLRPELTPLAVELIDSLHPWPHRWGYWERWKDQLEFAAQACQIPGLRPMRGRFLSYLAALYQYTGQLDLAVQTSQAALDECRCCADWLIFGRAGLQLASAVNSLGNSAQAAQIIADLKAEAQQNAPAGIQQHTALAHFMLYDMHTLRREGKLAEATEIGNQLIYHVEQLPEPPQDFLASVYENRGMVLRAAGKAPEAACDLEKTLAIYHQDGNLHAESNVRRNLGLIFWSMADLDQAEQYTRSAIRLDEQLNAHWNLTRAIGNLGLIYLSRGILSEALEYIRHQQKLAQSINDQVEMNRSSWNYAETLVYLGRFGEALPTLESVREKYEKKNLEAWIGVACDLSLCYAGLGDPDRALKFAQQAAAQAEAHQLEPCILVSLRCLAQYVPVEPAKAALQRALLLSRSLNRPLDEAGCLLWLASLAESPAETASLWESGTAILSRIGASAWVEGRSPTHPPLVILNI